MLATACGSPNASRTTNAVASTARSSGNPTSPTASAPAIRSLALVTLRGSNDIVVRDITDISHPKTVANLGAVSNPVFVNATEISYADGSNLYRAPLVGFPKTLVTAQGGAGTWSPDGAAVLYATSDEAGTTTTVHELKGGQDRLLGSVPGGGVGGCETIASCQIPNFLDFRLLFSPDGAMVSLVATGFSGSSFRLWTADGALLMSSDAYGPTMSVWSGSSLYFRDASGVEVWRAGVISPFLPGVIWVKPKASPTGGQLVYVARDRSGWSHTYVVDTTTKTVRELNSTRAEPVFFLTSRYIWYEGERACLASDACGPTPPFHPLSGKTYIYDLQDGTETESIISHVYDVWPHAA